MSEKDLLVIHVSDVIVDLELTLMSLEALDGKYA